MNKRQVGSRYEELAAEYLIEQGFRILEKNYRNHFGEIDLIAEDENGVLCYTEIKYRSTNRFGSPLEAVNRQKQRRISRAAAIHYARYGRAGSRPCRFDVIGIEADGTVCHIKNAFDAL